MVVVGSIKYRTTRRFAKLFAQKVNSFWFGATKNYRRKMLSAPFNYVVLVMGQDPGRTEKL
jgi:hypothetical protein